MPHLSAGMLLVRHWPVAPELLLVHPGGPFWARKDDGAWSIPKGEYQADDDPLAAAEREFVEELGSPCPPGPRLAIGEVRQKAGKIVRAWCVAGDIDTTSIVSNEFEMEWPPRSGRMQRFPEIDRAEFFDLATASRKILAAQEPFLQRALDALVSSE
jgi:predicted NUDIX family NTP pyrophosphohydrolase